MPAPRKAGPPPGKLTAYSPQSPQRQLDGFLDKYSPAVAATARAALVRMRARYPSALQLVYDNYNALAIGFSPTERSSDAIFSLALFPRWVSLFFLQARCIEDPHGLFKGTGNMARHIVLDTAERLDDPRVRELMQLALRKARVPFDPAAMPALIIKSVSAKQRPRRPKKET